MSGQHRHRDTSASEDDEQPAGSGGDGGGVRRALRALGPGIVTGAADDDPSGIATYAQSGALYGTGLLWTVPVTLPLMIVVQEACERMTLATGDSFGALIRRRFQRGARTWITVLLAALLVANSVNAAADLVAIGEGMSLLDAGPAPLWSLIAGVVIGFVVVRGSFAWISRIFKWLCLVLFAYVGVVIVASVDWGDVLSGLLGRGFEWQPQYLGLVVAVLGTTISPYMFFWQTEEREEMLRSEARSGRRARPERAKPLTLDGQSPAQALRALWLGRLDVIVGMLFSVAIMFAIIVSAAATLGVHHQKVDSAEAAAKALQPIAGDFAFALFAIGFIGSGMLAVPDVADQGLLPPHGKPSRTDRTADADNEGSPPPEADTDDQLPGTDDCLHGQVRTGALNGDTADGAQASDPLRDPAPGPGQVPERDPDIAPPTAPERAPAPEEDPEVAPLTDPEFDPAPDRDPDFRDPQRPEGTPI